MRFSHDEPHIQEGSLICNSLTLISSVYTLNTLVTLYLVKYIMILTSDDQRLDESISYLEHVKD